MTDQAIRWLQQAIQTATERIRKFQDRGMGEQNTKASLIEPILEALGWDVRDPTRSNYRLNRTCAGIRPA